MRCFTFLYLDIYGSRYCVACNVIQIFTRLFQVRTAFKKKNHICCFLTWLIFKCGVSKKKIRYLLCNSLYLAIHSTRTMIVCYKLNLHFILVVTKPTRNNMRLYCIHYDLYHATVLHRIAQTNTNTSSMFVNTNLLTISQYHANSNQICLLQDLVYHWNLARNISIGYNGLSRYGYKSIVCSNA